MDISKLLSHTNLASVPVYEPGKPIEELERELGIKGAIKMASNENPFGPSPKAIARIRKSLKKANRYPDASSFYLKKALSKKFKVPTDRIALGNGSDELIVMAVRAFLGIGEEIVTAVPTFLIYRIAALVQGGKPIEVPMKDFRYDLQGIAARITPKTKIVFIANPDNPVGTYVTRNELRRFLDRVPRNVIVFLDEAYSEFAKTRRDYPDGIDFLSYPNVVVSRTFSKAYGLSGLRIGYAFGSLEVIKALNKVREPFNINLFAQEGALGALEDTAFLKKVVRTTEAEKKRLVRELGKLGVKTIPSATNFLLTSVGSEAPKIYAELLKRGIIVRLMRSWGLDGKLRITIGTPRENGKFLLAFKSALQAVHRRK